LVYEDTRKHYEFITKERNEMIPTILKSLTDENVNNLVVVNSLNWDRCEVIELPKNFDSVQRSHSGNPLGLVHAPSMGYASNKDFNEKLDLKIKENTNSIEMENSFIVVSIDKKEGNLNIFDKRIERETVTKGNQFVLHNDVPLFWDAWDVEIYHLQSKKFINNVESIKIIEDGPLRVSVELITIISKTSKVSQIISLTGINSRIDFKTHVDWDENRKFLKVEFPTMVSATHATYEIQYGHLKRPTHYNTSWDVAQFEVCAQKFVDLSEFGYGVSLLNNGKHGHNIHDGIITLSLLKAPKAPDANCDIGKHEFTYSLFPHLNSFQDSGVVQEAYNLNSPLIAISANENLKEKSFFSVDKKNIVIESVKKSEDSDDLIVRLYESFGGHVKATLKWNMEVKSVFCCNMLEEEKSEKLEIKENQVHVQFKPFEIVTLKLKK
jgi:alpha-mannosidase